MDRRIVVSQWLVARQITNNLDILFSWINKYIYLINTTTGRVTTALLCQRMIENCFDAGREVEVEVSQSSLDLICH